MTTTTTDFANTNTSRKGLGGEKALPTLLVFSPTWPEKTSGYGLAIRSSLAVLQTTDREIHFVVLSADPAPSGLAADYPSVHFAHIPIDHESKFKRLIRSLGARYPATVIRFLSANAGQQVSAYLNQCVNQDAECCVIFEDIGCSVHMERIASHIPHARFAARLHNVLSTSFNVLRDQSNPAVKAAWSLEIARIRRFETDRLRKFSRAWTITADDRRACRRVLGASLDGVMSLSVDHARYANVADSEESTLVWLGTADARKGAGIAAFLGHAWPAIRRALPRAKFVVAGYGTERFDEPRAGIEGLGPVADDRFTLGRGQVFVNPQESGSGIKVKSLVAMAAGRAVVSTPVGVEGIPGTSGKHFVVHARPGEMTDAIVSLLDNRERAREIGKQAREFVVERFSGDAFHQSAMPLLSDFLSPSRRPSRPVLHHDPRQVSNKLIEATP